MLKLKARNKKDEQARKKREAYLKTPAGQAELARLQQKRHYQEMMDLQRQQMDYQMQQAQNARNQQTFNQIQQMNYQIQQTQQAIQSITPQTIIVKPAYQAPCFGTGPCWSF